MRFISTTHTKGHIFTSPGPEVPECEGSREVTVPPEMKIKASLLLDRVSPRKRCRRCTSEGARYQGAGGADSPFSGSYPEADRCSFQMIDSPTRGNLSPVGTQEHKSRAREEKLTSTPRLAFSLVRRVQHPGLTLQPREAHTGEGPVAVRINGDHKLVWPPSAF